jgi:dihydroceramide fatty acyl 2-hydroxylase
MARSDQARPVTCRMFETPLIERFSRVHPVAPFLFWTPVIALFGGRVFGSETSLPAAVGCFVAGLLIWSLAEYLLHRFVFHRIAPTPAGRRLYFVLHGVHHDFPSDGSRLVMPLGVSIPMGVAVYLLLRAVLGLAFGVSTAHVEAVFMGFGAGYLAYDGIHYATHHFRMTSPIGRWLKRYHMVHHHTGENARWGVSSPLWDWVFGTMGETRASSESVVDAR